MLKEKTVEKVTRVVRFLLTDRTTKFQFSKPRAFTFPNMRKSGLYIHIPFCRQLCPYCPYNRIRYKESLIKPFIDALVKEIAFYRAQLPELEITSVYFGGGTPTVVDGELERIVTTVRNAFPIHGPFCIETNPADLTKEKVRLLKSIGIDTLSLGVQSFHQPFLNLLGRTYTPDTVRQVLAWIGECDFSAVNVDLMFALPDQTLEHLESDLAQTMKFQVDQITAYPLFTFPYSTVGKYKNLKHVNMPALSIRKQMYYCLYDYLSQKGYHRVSVWSFKKRKDIPRYSSVTRERYIGFGPGAGSYFESSFTLNTFSVPAYIASVQQRGEAIALEMPLTRIMSIMYDFYWRVYDTYIPFERELETMRYSIRDVKRLHGLITLGRMLGLVTKTDTHFSLTRKGALWVHWLQNHFSLRYINTIWTIAKREAWPQYIRF